MPFTLSLKGKSKVKNDLSPNDTKTGSIIPGSNPSTLQRNNKKHEQGLSVVTFQSDFPTEIWQASPSPSPTASEKLLRKRCNYRKNMRNWNSTDTDDSSDDTGTSRDLSDNMSNSSSSSTSSLDELIIADQEKRRRRKRRQNKLKGSNNQSTSSSSTSESSVDDENHEWSPRKTQKPNVIPTNNNFMMSMCNPPTPMNTPRLYNQNCGQLASPNPSFTSHKPTPMLEFAQNTLVGMVGDYLPSPDWQRQYKVMPMRRNEVAYVDRQPPKTDRDLQEGASSWLLVRKWNPELKCPIGMAGFVPRYLCRTVDLPPPNFPRVSMTLSNTESVPSNVHSNWPSAMAQYANNVTPQSVMIEPGGDVYEDRDSGRGPSSGSDWGSGKGGLDESDNARLSQASWEKADCEYWTQQMPASTDGSPTKMPPPMAPLRSDITPRLLEKLNNLSLSDPDRTPTTQHFDLINRRQNASEREPSTSSKIPGTPEEPTGKPMIVAPHSNPSSWEPYQTMIQVSEDTLEKFTLV